MTEIAIAVGLRYPKYAVYPVSLINPVSRSKNQWCGQSVRP